MTEKQLALPCDCVVNCEIMLVSEWEKYGEEPDHFMIDFYTKPENLSFRYRFKQLWYLMSGNKDKVFFHGVVLYRNKAEQLRDLLVEALGKDGKEQNTHN